MALVVRDSVIYLLCIFDSYSDIRQLALHRIKHAEMTEDTAHAPADFNLDAYIAAGELNVRCGTDIHLKCRFLKPHGLYLQETPLSTDQTITWEDETTFTLEATVTWSAALMRWLLGWSADIEVLGPADLVKAYKMELKRLIERAK